MQKILIGGSRQLSKNFYPQVAQVVQSVQASGCCVHVGCASGADQFAIQAALARPARLHVFAQFAPSGAGSFASSALVQVFNAQQAGASVRFLAGGSLSVPLRARLFQRSLAALRGTAAAVFFLAHPGRSGSLTVAAQAAALGIPVFVFPLGFPGGQPTALRHLPGAWRPASFAGSACLQWAAGPSLF